MKLQVYSRSFFIKSFIIREKALGKEHPDTATAYNNIASVYLYQRDYPKALEWYQKSLVIYEKILGKKHPLTINTHNNIVVARKNLRRAGSLL